MQIHAPSDFPFFGSIGQFWCLYRQVIRETWETPSFNWGYHAMIGVIGASFTAEYFFKGLYEMTIGRLTAWWASDGEWRARTREDRFIQRVAREYSTFIHATPWYEFPFGAKLKELWSLDGPSEGGTIRHWERRFAMTLELLFKAAWGWTIKQGTAAGYDPETMEIQAWVTYPKSEQALGAIDPSLRVLSPLGPDSYLVSLPRYESFRKSVEALIANGVRFEEVAGNEQILLTLVAPQEWHPRSGHGTQVCEWTILTDPTHKRIALLAPVGRLHAILPTYDRDGLALDHLYDF